VGAGAGGAARYWLGYRDSQAGRDYELIAAPLDVELVSGHVTPAWAFGGSAPGTELRVRQGEWLRVRFVNRLTVPTTIHWHGIRLPLEMDGVPYVSQLPVLPGEYFDYRFRVPDAGSYWYHPHVTSSEQLGRGLVGPLIVEEREPTGFEHEATLCLKNWHVDETGAFLPFSIAREAARNGTQGRLSSINGVPQAVIDLPAGQIVRVRLLNVDNTATYRLNLRGDAEMRLYALDGNPIEPRALEEDYWLGPGMRICLAIRMPPAGAELALRDGSVRLGTLRSVSGGAQLKAGRGAQPGHAQAGDGTYVASAQAPANEGPGLLPNQVRPLDWPPPLPSNPLPEPDLATAEKVGFTFEWAGAVSAKLGEGPSSFWQINGQAWDIDDKSCADRPIARLRLGQSYIFDMRNLTQYQHPIHLHGMSFKVLSSNKRKIVPYFTDTFLLGKNERAQVALVADNPGVWMFHCHVIDHMETGLMAAIEVS
jgi:FtsP/CotA-like multicopper oxidase with cupredoxin domain